MTLAHRNDPTSKHTPHKTDEETAARQWHAGRCRLLDSPSMSSEDEDVHEFTQNELNKMLYFWDDTTEPVQEYHYMKLEWLHSKEPEENDLQKNAHDNGHRTIVDLYKDVPKGEEPVFLDLDTQDSAHVVEFYAPWCP
jgi:hypothetical protein